MSQSAAVGAEAEAAKPSRRAYDEIPIGVRRFATTPEYLGLGRDVYPAILDTLVSIFGGKYQEAVLCWGIGSGKSFLCSLALLYMVYRTLCLRDPQQHYGLAAGSPIHIVNVGPTARVAEKVIYGQMRAMVERSPWFAEKYPADARLRRELHFPKQVELLPGNSSELFPLGLNVLGATMDEAAFFVETREGEQENAEEVYLALLRRIQSRFGERGLILLASSPRHGEDFIMRKLAEAESEPTIYGSQKATWEVKPGLGKLVTVEGGLEVPAKLADAFRRNPEKARRDYAAIPGAAFEPFFVDMGALEAACEDGGRPRQRYALTLLPAFASERLGEGKGRGDGKGDPPPAPSLCSQASAWVRGDGKGNGNSKGNDAGGGLRHPLDEVGRLAEWFRPLDRAERFIHVDLGLRKDACGIAMARIVGERGQPVAVVELIHRIAAPPGGEVSLAGVRELILAIRARGFPIAQVSYDGWQSADSQQILRRHGLNVTTVSVDRDVAAYETLKELANEGRLRLYRHERFLQECRRLELVRGEKVDHPKRGSKDVADAVAGAVSEAVKAWGGGSVRGRIV